VTGKDEERRAVSEKIGLLAGNGLLPVCFARGARKRGIRVVAAAIEGEASAELEKEVDEIHWTGLAKLGAWVKIFKNAGVDRVVMCGGIRKVKVFNPVRAGPLLPDLKSAMLWFRKLRSHADHTVLEAVADEFEAEGIKVENSILYCPELLAQEGCLTKRKPTRREWDDIRFGWPLAKQIAALQIGQTIVVKDRSVIAVEGIDGTDATLRRGGKLGRGDVVAIKVAKEGHDERFDVPCVGPATVDTMQEAGVLVLAIEAGKTLVLERDQLSEKANQAGVTVIAVARPEAG